MTELARDVGARERPRRGRGDGDVAACASITVELGLVRERRRRRMAKRGASKGLLAQRAAAAAGGRSCELFHWRSARPAGRPSARCPTGVRRQAWSGPAVRASADLARSSSFVVAPVLGLRQAQRPRPREQAALLADHLLYGHVLSEMRAAGDEDADGS